MKFLVFLAIGWAVIAFIKFMFKAISEAGNGGGKADTTMMQHGFKGRVRQKTQILDDGTEIEVFAAQIKGIILGEYERWDGTIRVGMVDITESRDGSFPVLCAIDAFCRPETCIFEFASQPQQLGEMAYIEEWMTIFTVPTEALQFPKKGQRKVLFYFGVTDHQMSQLQANYDELELDYLAREAGYVELDHVQREVDRMTVQLAVLVSAADGELVATEGKVVQDWIKRRVSTESNEERITEIKSELNDAVRDAAAMRDNPAGNIATMCERIAEVGVVAHRYDALELCLEVAAADGSAEQSELELIEAIARGLEVDAGRLKEMVQKALPIGMFADKDPDSVLGITKAMEPQEIKKLLNDEYRKWNSRVSHKDKKVREQATEMLALIADARKRHVG